MDLREISATANMTGVVLQALTHIVMHQNIDLSSIKLQAKNEDGEDLADSEVALEDLLETVHNDLEALKDGDYVLVPKKNNDKEQQ